MIFSRKFEKNQTNNIYNNIVNIINNGIKGDGTDEHLI